MKRLIKKTLVFVTCLVVLFCIILLLPPTPRTSSGMLFSEVKKDSLLVNVPSPRIIFVGGSNLSFGLDSRKIRDSLHINPINTAIHANFGIKYMLENTAQYAKKSDIIVIAPEYHHFFRPWNFDSEALSVLIFDVNKSKIRLLNAEQMYHCFLYRGNSILSKVNISDYVPRKYNDAYHVNSFNEFGDIYKHWTLENRKVKPDKSIDVAEYNPNVMEGIKRIANIFKEKGCIFLVSYPNFQEASYNNSIEAIKKVEKEYVANGFNILGSPERYMMPDSLMFDTPYHVNKEGVDRRTELLIEDLRKALYHHELR